VRIRRLSLPAFGAFLDRELALPEGPGVILGPNEAGKSTLFTAVTTLLYGFRPANAEQFPYVPRAGGRYAELAAEVALDDGGSGQLSRRLRSSPQGEWQGPGGRETLNNKPLPVAAHVDRDLYHALYALTIDDMRDMEGDAFRQVEQRLLGELGNPWQRPARAVADELAEAAKGQWRQDNRGKSRHKELKNERSELRQGLKTAQTRQAQLREHEAERFRLGERLAELEARRRSLRDRISRSEAVGDLKERLERLDGLARNLGDTEAVRALGADPRREWQQLEQAEADWANRRQEWVQAVARERDRRDALTRQDRELLEDAEAAGLAATAAQVDEVGAALARLRREEERAGGELAEAAAETLTAAWDEAYGEALEGLAPADLRARCEAAASAREKRREAERRLADLPPQPVYGRIPRGYLYGLLAAAAALAGGAWWWWPLAIAAVAAGAGAAGVTVFNRSRAHVERQERERWQQTRDERQRELDLAREAEGEAASAVARLVPELPLPQPDIDEPRPELADRLVSLRNAWRRYREARSEREEAEGDWTRRASGVVVVLARHAAGAVDKANLQATATALEQRLEAARRRRDVADEARRALADLGRQRRGLRAEAEDLARRRADWEARLARVAPDAADNEERLQRAEEAVALYQRWRAGWEDLRASYPDIPDPRARVAQAGEDLLEGGDLESARESLTELDDQRTELRDKIGELDRELDHGGQKADVGLIQGRLTEVEEALAEAEREHDRLRLLESLVREADRRFREAHQPDVLRRASAYLERVTGGRYGQLLLEEGGDGALRVRDAAGDDHAVDPDTAALSRGTRDQIYLALRLAVADHLDAGHERLPLLLDEVFVHWDPQRQEAGLAALGAMAGDRQVLLFTCHPEMAQRAGRALHTEPVTLAGPIEPAGSAAPAE
jgi:uncharacterized protein YhaN